jgi:hypothetical protein
VDPAKVPESGVRARCSVCAGLIAVRRPPISAPVLPPIDIPLPPVDVRPPAPVAERPRDPEPVVQEAPAPAPTPTAPPAEIVVREMAPPVMPPAVPFTTLPPEPTPAPRATAPAAEVEAPAAAPGRFANPFLQQDPATRARRLARALVSDLVVYHPEKRQRGLADGTLKELFSEEIRKSWEEYSDQVGEEIASTTPWFTEALNEILAEGRPLFG